MNLKPIRKKFLPRLLIAIFLLFFLPTPSLTSAEEININTGKVGYFSSAGEEIPLHVKGVGEQTPEKVARRFFTEYGLEFGILNQAQDLEHVATWGGDESSRTIKFGSFVPTPTPEEVTHVHFRQGYRGVPVFAADVLVHLSGENILSVSSNFLSEPNIDTQPTVTKDQARELAKGIWQSKGLTANFIGDPVLYILNPSLIKPAENRNYLAWYIEVKNNNEAATEREFLFIDAHTGMLVATLPGIFDARNRRTYNCQGGCRLAFSEGQEPQATDDSDTANAHRYAGQTYDYYKNSHNRDSFNNAGATIVSYADYRCNSPNAWWNGSTLNFCSGMTTKDIYAHEFTHAVTQYTANLNYLYQSGALNEAISDVLGSHLDGNWQLGEDSILGEIRSMSNPPSHRQPDRLFNRNYYYCGHGDNGGVHINSGVINKLGYLIAAGGSFNSCQISGLGRDKMGKIIYSALTNYLTSSANFGNFYYAVKDACEQGLYGAASFECTQVINAMKAVEIDQQPFGSSVSPVCQGLTPATPSCGEVGGPSPTSGPSSTPTPTSTSGPTPTSGPAQPSATSSPPQTPTESIAIWNTGLINGQEIAVVNGSKLPKGIRVSICYNRAGGYNRLTVDRGGGLGFSVAKTFPQNDSAQNRCLRVIFADGSSTKFLPLGELATSQGSPHVYTLESGGKTVSTTILVTTGLVDIPQEPTATVSAPTPTEGQIPTVDPNNTPTVTIAPSPTASSKNIASLINSVSQDEIRKHLTNLVDDDEVSGFDEAQTRWSRFSGNQAEANYIKSQFEVIGVAVEFQPFSFNYQGLTFNTQNIIGKIDGRNSNQVYLLTAHMDSTAASSGTNDPAPGADDNGSGTAVVMETAAVLKSVSNQLNTSLEFILFSGEEQGLWGSYHYVNNLSSQKTIKGVVNIDMIGNQGPSGDCTNFGYKPYNGGDVLSQAIVSANRKYNIGLDASSVQSSNGRSDHKPFWDRGIPAIFGFECDFSPVYHTVNDKLDKINFNQLTKNAKALVAALAELAMEE